MDLMQYKGKSIIAWLSYNENYEESFDRVNRVCYVYPRIIVKGGVYDLIDSADFPKSGAIEVRIQGNESAEEVFDRVGQLVSIKINGDFVPNYDSRNEYSLKYNYLFGKMTSQIWIEPFSTKGLYQIIDYNINIDELKNDKAIPEPDCDIRTTLVLLRCDDKMYGPFEYDIKEGNLLLRGSRDKDYFIGEYDAQKYNDELLFVNDQNGKEAVLLIPADSLSSFGSEDKRYDWISKETLMDGFVDSLRVKNMYSREQVRELKDMIHHLVDKEYDLDYTEERIHKICSLFGDYTFKEDHIQEIVQFAVSSEALKDILIKELVNNHFDEVQDRMSEFEEVKEKLEELKSQELSLKQSNQSLKDQIDAKNASVFSDDQNRIKELLGEVERLKSENAKLIEKDDAEKSIEELRNELDIIEQARKKANERYQQQVIENHDLEKSFESTLEQFNDKAKQTARILDSKLLDKILRGVGDESTDEKPDKFDVNRLHSESMDYRGIANRVEKFINDCAHRTVSFNEVVNYLICISQGFITTFAGEPGTGKTSLCNILAKSLGLVTDAKQKRFVDISVERGWSSHKDFIGYYNPLTKSMVKSNVDVFNAFKVMDDEYNEEPSKIAPFIVLLDEANLSPIEHYWAAFLRNCDISSVTNRTISLGGNNSFKLPEHLRFLATVNFDHTTEELSPRFLDRSWVIMLEPSRIDEEADEDIPNCEDMISFADLREAFFVKEQDDKIDEAILNKWNAIQRVFKERDLQIMPRNLKMVKNYCAVGCRCMDRDTPATRLAPLDYAFSQKILPTINGSGKNYRILIEELLKECTFQNMPISARHLDRMKRVAENNMDFYQFFSR